MTSEQHGFFRGLIQCMDILASLAILVTLSPVILLLVLIQLFIIIVAKVKFGSSTSLRDLSKAGKNCLIVELDGQLELSQLRERLQQKLTDAKSSEGRWLHPKLRSKVKYVLNFGFYMLDESFDIKNHVVPDGGQVQVFTSKQEVCKMIKSIAESDAEPIWKVHLLYFRTGDTHQNQLKSILVIMTEHSLSDFYSTANVFMDAMSDRKPSDKSERKVCISAGYSMSWLEAFKARLCGVAGLFHSHPIVAAISWRPSNPFDLQKQTNRAVARLLGRCPTESQLVFLPPPIFINQDLLNDIRNVTTVGEFPILICAILRAMVKFWYKCKLDQPLSLESSKTWTFSIGISVPLWDPAAHLEIANKSAVIRPMFRVEEFLDSDITKALKYVRGQVDKAMVDSTWVQWAFHELIFRNLPEAAQRFSSKMKETLLPVTFSMSSVTFRSPTECLIFGNQVDLMAFHPFVSPTQGASVVFHDELVILQLCASSMMFGSESELKEVLKMAKDEVLAIHADLVQSNHAQDAANIEDSLKRKHGFLLGYASEDNEN